MVSVPNWLQLQGVSALTEHPSGWDRLKLSPRTMPSSWKGGWFPRRHLNFPMCTVFCLPSPPKNKQTNEQQQKVKTKTNQKKKLFLRGESLWQTTGLGDGYQPFHCLVLSFVMVRGIACVVLFIVWFSNHRQIWRGTASLLWYLMMLVKQLHFSSFVCVLITAYLSLSHQLMKGDARKQPQVAQPSLPQLWLAQRRL